MRRRLAIAAPVGAGLFTIGWLVLGAISPGYRLFDLVIEPYSPISQPVSGLGLGVTGPWMNAAFIVGGILLITGTIAAAPGWWALGRLGRIAVVFVALVGVGMVVNGVFTLESVLPHLAGFILAVPLPAIGLVLGGMAWRSRSRAIAIGSIAGGVLTLILFAVFMATFDPYSAGGNAGVAGLVQRLAITALLVSVGATVVTTARIGASRSGPRREPMPARTAP